MNGIDTQRRGVGRGAVALLCLAVALTGCMRRDNDQNRDRPGGPLYRMWDGAGDRVMVEGADGAASLKLRRRDDGYKVYGSDLVAEGYVRWKDGAEQPGDTGAVTAALEVRTVVDTKWTALKRPADGVWERPGGFRLERTGRGWAVFDVEAEWLGRFTHTDGDWGLVVGRESPTRLNVATRDGLQVLQTDAGKERRRVTAGRLPAPLVLAAGLDALAPLDRVAVGVLLGRLNDSASKKSDTEAGQHTGEQGDAADGGG